MTVISRWSAGTRALAMAFGIALSASCTPAAETPTEPALEAEARAAASALGSALKAELVAAMSSEGPSAAVRVCNERAPEIAQAVSGETGMVVSRTALRLRNRENAPDGWEAEQLRIFEAALEGGADPAGLQAATIVETDGTRTFRWMAPIVMEGACATCHGPAVPEDLLAEIRTLYPEDEATGFEQGELRGAFSVRQALP